MARRVVTTNLSIRAVAVGAFLGTYSHIVLDSVMHAGIRPFAPFSDTNPLLAVVSLRALHLFCVIAGALGIVALPVRRALRSAGQPGRT